jgi:hypothetical protein
MFGYWGWGTSTKQLTESTDAVEKQRGFAPPVFVDIRIHRNSQAVGFKNDALKSVVGEDRYQWMSDLGNEAVLPGSTSHKRIQIRSPKAAVELLKLVQQRAKENRHVIYFCACECPRFCHRYEVAKLLLKAANRKGVPLEVVEWPGKEPTSEPVTLAIRDQKNAHAKRLSLDIAQPLWAFAGLPFGATVRVVRSAGPQIVPVAPVRFAPGGWYLPILQGGDGIEMRISRRAIQIWRKSRGYNSLFAALV